MGIYKDITLYCDICGKEGCGSISIAETRVTALASGWKRKKIEDEYKDICPDCQNEDIAP